MVHLLVAVLAAALLGTVILLAHRRRQRQHDLNPLSRMRLSEQDIARLAKVSVQRFLDDDQRGIKHATMASRYTRRG